MKRLHSLSARAERRRAPAFALVFAALTLFSFFQPAVSVHAADGDSPEQEFTESLPEFIEGSTYVGGQAYVESRSGFIFEDDEEGGVIITGYKEQERNLVLPASIDGKPVTGIAETAFYGSDLISAVLPEGMTWIGDDAFGHCTSLAEITLPSTLKSIGHEAFRGCEMLRAITLPEGLVSIGDSAFEGCLRLKKLTIPASVGEIGVDAFAACAALTLDCSQNEAARAYAVANAIPTGFADTGAFTLLICGCITAGLLVLLVILRAVWVGRNKSKG